MKKVILVANRSKDIGLCLADQTATLLGTFCECIYVQQDMLPDIHTPCAVGYRPQQPPKDAELLLVLGGDGTMLHAAELALALDIPLLGVNLGRLGYLAGIEPAEISKLSRLSDDAYTEQTRMTLALSVIKKTGEEQALGCYAVNDVVMDGGGHLADIRLYAAGAALDYRADGLILSTPTGSTAYSLSAGGPVIDDKMDALCVTPICPRSFFSRSLLFEAGTVLEAENLGGRQEALRITVDGTERALLSAGERLRVTRADQRLRLLSFGEGSLLDVLCTKMKMNHF